MLVRGVIEAQIRNAAAGAGGVVVRGIRQVGRESFRFRLVPAPGTETRRRSVGGVWEGRERRVHAACWHQYGRFMRRLFDAAPGAVIVAGSDGDGRPIRYNGVGDFNALADSTGDRNVGGAYRPVAYRDACICERDESDGYDAANDWV
jgi:hypothetical protein